MKVRIVALAMLVVTIFTISASASLPGTMTGEKFFDENGNGIKDIGEVGLPGWTIMATSMNGDVYTAMTDPDGKYTLDLDTGEYVVIEIQQDGWTQTYPAGGSYDVAVLAGEILPDINFGNAKDCHCIQLDIQPNVERAKGDYTNISGSAAINGSDPNQKTVDITIDIEWNIKMFCAGLPGTCSATVVPSFQNQWKIGNYGGTQTSQSGTPATINCQGTCDNPTHSTETQSKVKTQHKFTVTKQGGGNANNDNVRGTLTVTLADSSQPPCPITDNTVTIYFFANMKNGAGDGKIKVR